MLNKSYTPYQDVNQIVEEFLVKVKNILKGQFVGMYLFGSLSTGDFDLHSDVDILIVTQDKVSKETFEALKAMHEQISTSDSPWAIQLEVSYFPKQALRCFNREDMLHPRLNRGNNELLHWMNHESDWVIQRHVLREKGIVVDGPSLQTLIESVSGEEIRQAVIDVLPLWANPILDDLTPIHNRGHQSFFVLSMCRMLYTLQYGEVISKRAAAEWAIETLNPKWKSLIQQAIIGRQTPNEQADMDNINTTLDLIRYTVKHSRPTIYLDINQVLNLLLDGAKEILAEQFVGMYLYGSLSSGDFDPKSSDIDFLVVTEDILPDETISELRSLHERLWDSGLKWALKWALKLEGSYISKTLIRVHDPNGPTCPTINEGRFFVDGRGSDWIIQRHVIREYGVVVEGPDPKSLIDPVNPNDIRSAVTGILNEWWFPMLTKPTWLQTHESGDRAFAVITMCRVLHALEYGTIVSKPKAVAWAGTRLGKSWRQLINKAVRVYEDENLDISLTEALDFIRFVKQDIDSKMGQPG